MRSSTVGIGDLVAVQVQHRQHHAVLGRMHELVGVPAGRQRSGLGFAVTDDGDHEQVGVVEGRPVGVRQRVAQFATLVDGAGCLRGDVRRDTAGEGELAEQPAQALGVRSDVGVGLGVGAVEVGVGDQAGTAVAGSGDVDRRLFALCDRPVEVGVEEVQPGSGAPVAEQPGFDVVAGQRRSQQRVVQQVDLAHREVVGGAPPPVDLLEHLVRRCRCHDVIQPPIVGRGGFENRLFTRASIS